MTKFYIHIHLYTFFQNYEISIGVFQSKYLFHISICIRKLLAIMRIMVIQTRVTLIKVEAQNFSNKCFIRNFV